MSDEKIELSGQVVELSETNTYIEMTNRLCYYNEPNLNGIVLPEEGAHDKAYTLINQPVVAKYVDYQGKPDLGGHEVVMTKNGAKFGTEKIGVHTNVFIQPDTVNINGEAKTLPCLFATCRIWTRNAENMIAAIKRLFSENRLFSSWEILTSGYVIKDGLKYLTDYVFEANCLLGTNHNPSYGSCATALTIAETDEKAPEMLIAEALAMDIKNSKKKEDKALENETKEMIENTDSENAESAIETTENTEATENETVAENVDNQKNIAETEPETTETETASDSVEKVETETAEKIIETLNNKIETLSAEIAAKNDVILANDETIKTLKAENEVLMTYKDMFEKAEKEKAEKELAEKQSALKSYALKSGYISAEEIETNDEIKTAIAEVNEIAIKSLIVDRLMSSKNTVETSETVETKNQSQEVETASLLVDDDEVIDYKTVMKKYLKK